MKSAYELAMERLEKTAPTQKVTDAQKAEIHEIDNRYKAKIAERETFLQSKIAGASAAGNRREADELQQQLARDIYTLREECEEKKEKVRKV